ncbi:hypothetical protein ACS0TY_011476 [Phlomoides rotata]
MFKNNKEFKRSTSWEDKIFKEETTIKASKTFKANHKGNFLKIHREGGSSSYNPNFKHHENFSYTNQKVVVQFPPGFNSGAKPPNNEGRPAQDEVMEAMLKKMEEFMKNTSGQIKTLEHQMGQLASTVGEQHQKGKFPSTTETNPREHCKAIKLRSGTSYDGPSKPLDEEEKGGDEEEEELELARKMRKTRAWEPKERRRKSKKRWMKSQRKMKCTTSAQMETSKGFEGKRE